LTELGSRIWARLNERERKILHGICNGLSSKDIAADLGATDTAVRTISKRLYDKTGTDNRLHVVIFAFYHGLVECPCKAS
jgi:DNA-binding NarL/FixJ family response regulator